MAASPDPGHAEVIGVLGGTRCGHGVMLTHACRLQLLPGLSAYIYVCSAVVIKTAVGRCCVVGSGPPGNSTGCMRDPAKRELTGGLAVPLYAFSAVAVCLSVWPFRCLSVRQFGAVSVCVCQTCLPSDWVVPRRRSLPRGARTLHGVLLLVVPRSRCLVCAG